MSLAVLLVSTVVQLLAISDAGLCNSNSLFRDFLIHDVPVKSTGWGNLWSRTIPYEIFRLQRNESSSLEKSIEMFHTHTCLKFVYKNSYHNDYMYFFDGGSGKCYASNNGRSRGSSHISLGRGCDLAIPARYIMYTLGRNYEQNRPDRDQYVSVNFNFIDPSYQSYFTKDPYMDTQSIQYDYLSVTHFRRNEYNSTPFYNTVESIARDGYAAVFGQCERLSMYDIEHINIRYCPERMIRLAKGSAPDNGRVEVFVNGRWGTICKDQYFDNTDANVICKYLGFPSFEEIYNPTQERRGKIWFHRMQCNGNEHSPFSCAKISEHVSIYCFRGSVVKLKCERNIRLLGSVHFNEGRVVVYAERRWGSLCADGFTLTNANVLCRQLGYDKAEYHWAVSANLNYPLIMEKMNCVGNEYNIAHCPRGSPVGDVDPNCRYIVWIKCTGEYTDDRI